MTFFDWIETTRNRLETHPPGWVAKQQAHELWIGALRRLAQPKSGDTIWDREWDVLCVLDACRYDLMCELCETEAFPWLPPAGEVRDMWSVGSTSLEWMENTFTPESEGEMSRVGYLTGNLFARNLNTDAFAYYAECEPTYNETEDIYTVDPDRLTDWAIDTFRNRSDFGFDRLIVHYMQPHTPFRARSEWFDHERNLRTTWGESFTQLRDREIDRDEFWAAYLENLRWVCGSIDRLRNNCAADRLLLTADHGNGLGEFGVYGHPFGVHTESVRRVPWVEIDSRDTGEYEPVVDWETNEKQLTEEEVSERLRALGYR